MCTEGLGRSDAKTIFGTEEFGGIQMSKLCQVSVRVDQSMLAASVGSGDVSVLSTPAMIALMEQAAVRCVGGLIGEGETTVSAQMEVAHISAVPVGEEITATAEIIKQAGKKILFKVFCEDKNGIVGKGTHMRLVVNRDRFQQRANAKKERVRG